jgi:hypothetical protein
VSTSSQIVDLVVERIDLASRNGLIPLGMLSYSMETDKLIFTCLPGVDFDEANAVMEKFGRTLNKLER